MLGAPLVGKQLGKLQEVSGGPSSRLTPYCSQELKVSLSPGLAWITTQVPGASGQPWEGKSKRVYYSLSSLAVVLVGHRARHGGLEQRAPFSIKDEGSSKH